MNNGCIYLITNILNNRQYVGKTIYSTPSHRFNQHISYGIRQCTKKYPLHKDIMKYGRGSFKIEILCKAQINNLANMEAYFAEQLETYIWDSPLFHPKGYNAYWCGEKGNLGIKHTETTKQKIRITREKNGINKKISIFMKGNTNGFKKGYKLTDENKNKIKMSRIGKKIPDEVKLKIRNSLLNKKQTDEQKYNSLQGRILTKNKNNKFSIKLNDDIVKEILEKYNQKIYTVSKLATIYNVSYNTINSIIKGISWKHIPRINININNEKLN